MEKNYHLFIRSRGSKRGICLLGFPNRSERAEAEDFLKNSARFAVEVEFLHFSSCVPANLIGLEDAEVICNGK